MPKKVDLTGKKFEMLTAIRPTEKRQGSSIIWLCKCDCGNYKEITQKHFGETKSCGCLMGKGHIHNHSSSPSPTYYSWLSMRQRCNNTNNCNYHRYGGRDITVCERWDSFENFLSDMGERPEGMTIDRIDNDGNYEPSNCKWSTMSEQSSNRIRTRKWAKLTDYEVKRIQWLLEVGKHSQRQIASMFNVSQTVIYRINRGKRHGL